MSTDRDVLLHGLSETQKRSFLNRVHMGLVRQCEEQIVRLSRELTIH